MAGIIEALAVLWAAIAGVSAVMYRRFRESLDGEMAALHARQWAAAHDALNAPPER